MRRAAIYARYSTDLQNERSVEDQVELCRGYAQREGLTIAAVYHDRARSGGSMLERDGLLALLAAAQAEPRGFDVIVVEAIDRLSRDMEDLAGLHKKLTFHGIEIAAVHEGVASTVVIGLRGLVGQLYREDGVKKVRRGMAGVVRSGRVAGSLGYGYRTVPGKPGERAIDEDEAGIVRRIFASYVAGDSPRAIAGALNREGVPAPRGRLWNASTINGTPSRGLGILNNESYVGRIVWNRSRKVRSPYTGSRLERRNPVEEREIADAPQLRLVDDATWEAVRTRKTERIGVPAAQQRRPRHLFSGLLICGACGSGMTMKDRDKHGRVRVRCSAVGESGSCDHRRCYSATAIADAAIGGMRETLRDSRLIEVFVRRYNDQRRKLAGDATRDRARLERRLAAAEREHERVLNGYVKGFVAEPEAEARLPVLRAEKERCAAELAAASEEPRVITLHPGLISSYLRQVDELAAELDAHARLGDEPSRRLTEVMRSLVQSVTVLPSQTRQPFEVEVRGRLAHLIGPEAFPAGRFGVYGGAG